MNIDALEKLLAAGTDNAMLRFTLGKLYFDRDECGKAIAHLRAATEHDPQYSAAWKWLGRALAQAGLFSDVRDAFRQGIAAAVEKGDKQAVKEMQVFLRRIEKTSDGEKE